MPWKERVIGTGMLLYLWVALGSALGGVLRFSLTRLAFLLEGVAPRSNVWSTVLINILGSFAIGWIGTATAHGSRFSVPDSARIFLMVGVCGGFTTFSSFSLQTLDLLRGGHFGRAAANIVASVLLCLAAVAAGHWLGEGRRPALAVASSALEERAS